MPSEFRSLFTLPDDLHYLNCAYMAPLPREVEEAGVAGIARKRVPSSMVAEDFFEEPERIRSLFGALVSAAAERIALIPSVSYGMANVARNVRVERGEHVLTVGEQFPSNVYPWRSAYGSDAVKAVDAPSEVEARGQRWNERILDAIGPQTRIVAMPHVHWADGTRFDLREIGVRARAVGACFVIDGTQSVGALPLSVSEVGADALVCAGYKWLFGPYSIGAAFYGERFDGGEPIENNWITREGSEDFRGLVAYRDAYQPAAFRYNVGELSNFILAPMFRAALQLVSEWTPEAVQAHCRGLVESATPRLEGAGCHVAPVSERGSHLFGVRLPAGADLDAVRASLGARNVSVSLRGDAIRVSPHLYNSAEDMDALCGAILDGMGGSVG